MAVQWGERLDYLKTTRRRLWNEDYFCFLVRQVWRLNHPVRVLDFGCGYGYLGLMLMPLLPEGSSYTGLDASEKLLREAEKACAGAPWEAGFIQADICGYSPAEDYDLAICQAFLRHLPAPAEALQKMIASVVPAGLVVCIEVNRRMENAGLYIEGMHFDSFEKDSLLEERWKQEARQDGRDYLLGIKAPIYMQRAGLQNVGARVNDCIEFVSPLDGEDGYDERLAALLRNNGLPAAGGAGEVFALQARNLIVSYGWKPPGR